MTDADRMILLALREYETGLCNCGNHRALSMDPDHDAFNQGHTARYVPDSFTCYACEQIELAQKAMAKENKGEMPEGRKLFAELIPRGLRRAN